LPQRDTPHTDIRKGNVMALTRPLLERDIEKRLVKTAEKNGRQTYKFTSPQRRSVPDRIVLGDIKNVRNLLKKNNVTAEEVMAEVLTFVELKAPGKKPTEAQLREHEKIRARGFRVLVLDTYEGIDEVYGGEA